MIIVKIFKTFNYYKCFAINQSYLRILQAKNRYNYLSIKNELVIIYLSESDNTRVKSIWKIVTNASYDVGR